jgi:hypothetical protein
MSRTVQQQLDAVDAAIAAIECGAQEYKIGWRSVRKPDLPALYAERRQLRMELERVYQTTVVQFNTR